MRPLTFRTQLTMNALTLLIMLLMVFSTNTFASPGFSVLGQTAPTTTISYQGRLTNRGGIAISASTPMVFRLYAAPTGGSALWSETRSGSNAVPVTNGIFSVLLGSITPISLELLSRDLWLGIAVNGDPEMTPREKIGSVPYAARAGSVVDGSITTPKLADTSVTGPKLADGSISNAKIVDQAVTNTKQTITTYNVTDNSQKRIQGTGNFALSEFRIENVPAGDVMFVATLTAQMYPNKPNSGTVWLDAGGEFVGMAPLHMIESDRDSQLTIHGKISNFAGGTLVVKVMVGPESADADINFGIEGDPRFGRQVTIIAGL